MYDLSQYYWGKQQRLDSLRAKKAIREADIEVSDMLSQFSGAFGMELSKQKTPAIYKVVERAVLTIRLSVTKPKATYMRTRPLAAACYARLHTCKEFLDDMSAAKKEFDKML